MWKSYYILLVEPSFWVEPVWFDRSVAEKMRCGASPQIPALRCAVSNHPCSTQSSFPSSAEEGSHQDSHPCLSGASENLRLIKIFGSWRGASKKRAQRDGSHAPAPPGGTSGDRALRGLTVIQVILRFTWHNHAL